MKPAGSSLDPSYIRWRLEFERFEASCFEALAEFVRLHFDDLLDEYYCGGHESLNAFPGWAFERYLLEVEGQGSREHLQ
jgi:hypothetical protein